MKIELTEKQAEAILWAAGMVDCSMYNYDESELVEYGYNKKMASLQQVIDKLQKLTSAEVA
jgi:hypothetical protein